MKFLKYITLYFTIVCLTAFFNSCGKKDEPQPIHAATHTLFMYFPWSDNLSSYFETNIEDMMTAIEHTGLNSQKVIIYLAESDNSATLYQIDLSRNRYIRNPVRRRNLGSQRRESHCSRRTLCHDHRKPWIRMDS